MNHFSGLLKAFSFNLHFFPNKLGSFVEGSCFYSHSLTQKNCVGFLIPDTCCPDKEPRKNTKSSKSPFGLRKHRPMMPFFFHTIRTNQISPFFWMGGRGGGECPKFQMSLFLGNISESLVLCENVGGVGNLAFSFPRFYEAGEIYVLGLGSWEDGLGNQR